MHKAPWLRALLGVSLAGMLLAALLPLAPAATPAVTAEGLPGWHTIGAKILDPNGNEFTISGINWYGFETRGAVAHGMWTKDYKVIVDQIKAYGFNTIRIPFSNEMWAKNPAPGANGISACPECKGKRARDIMALIVNYAGAVGLHVILDNHRSTGGDSAQENGFWYASGYPEQAWIDHWVSVQAWTHGIKQELGAPDALAVNHLAVDGLPVVLGFDLRNEPHTPARTAYLDGATWGSGDGVDPMVNPNPDAFTPACVASSTCHDWRLAAQRAGNTILTAAAEQGWDYPLIFVGGISTYPTAQGTAASGPYDWTWWGGNLRGVNGNASNPGAPVVFNRLRANAGIDKPLHERRIETAQPVYGQLVYSAHDYGPSLYKQGWFNSSTCYESGCSPSSLADVWYKFWAHLNLAGGVNPVGPGGQAYPWANTGHAAYAQSPVFLGEFGTGKTDGDLYSSGNGSQGQWLAALANFVQSSYDRTAANDPGYALTPLHWTYWALNEEDSYGLLGSNYSGLANQKKEYSFLCFIQRGPLAVPLGSGSGQCGSTGPLPAASSGGPIGSPTPTPTPVATPTVVATPTPTGSPTPAATATPTPPSGPSTAHIADLDGSSQAPGNGGWKANVRSLVQDAQGAPVSQATVTVAWNAGSAPSSSCTTGADGWCQAQSGTIPKNTTSIVASVQGVSHATLAYNAAGNHDPDGDGDGTTITVTR